VLLERDNLSSFYQKDVEWL